MRKIILLAISMMLALASGAWAQAGIDCKEGSDFVFCGYTDGCYKLNELHSDAVAEKNGDGLSCVKGSCPCATLRAGCTRDYGTLYTNATVPTVISGTPYGTGHACTEFDMTRQAGGNESCGFCDYGPITADGGGCHEIWANPSNVELPATCDAAETKCTVTDRGRKVTSCAAVSSSSSAVSSSSSTPSSSSSSASPSSSSAPASSSSSSLQAYDYCLIPNVNLCIPGPATAIDCILDNLSNSCPPGYNIPSSSSAVPSSSSVASSSSSNNASSSSNDGVDPSSNSSEDDSSSSGDENDGDSSSSSEGTQYAFCVIASDEICSELLVDYCEPAGGILSNDCPYRDVSSSSSDGSAPIIKLSQSVRSNMLVAMHNAINLQSSSNAVIQIYDLKGKAVRSLRYSQGSYVVPLAGLPKGLYIVKASNASWKQTVKVTVR